MTIVFPAPSKGLTMRFCYCTNDTPCNPCVEAAQEEQESPELLAEQRSFLDATADFYIAGWTPADEDAREHDRKILADMKEEAESNPDMAHALRALYPDEVYSYAGFLRDTKADAKDGI